MCGLVAAGYLLARATHDAGIQIDWAWWIAGAAVAAAVAGATSGRRCVGALMAAVVLLAGGWFMLSVAGPLRELPSEAEEGAVVRFRGVVRSAPEPAGVGQGALASFVPVEPAVEFEITLSGEPFAGRTVRVRVRGIFDDMPGWLRPGAVVGVLGRFSPIRNAGNPGEVDQRMAAAARGQVGSVDLPDVSLITRHEAGSFAESCRSTAYGWIGRAHARAMSVLRPVSPVGGAGATDDERASRALLAALLLGERDPALRDVGAAFQRLGLLHLVAISGFNLVIMGGMALFMLRLLRDPRALELCALAALIGAYMLLLPAQAPILRAGFIMLAAIAAEMLGRRHDRTTILGWVACGLLVWSPVQLWSLGFQLSVGIVAALLLLGDRTSGRLFGVELRGLVRRSVPAGRTPVREALPWLATRAAALVRANVSASLLAWGVSLPLIAVHTGLVSPLAVVSTLIVLPLTVVVLWIGYLALLTGIVVPSVGTTISEVVLDPLAGFLITVVMRLDQVPGLSVRVPAVSIWWAVACVGVVVFLVRFGRARDRLTWALLACICGWVAGECFVRPRWEARYPLRIDSISVGRGSCHLVRTPTHTLMYACGSGSSGIGLRRVPEACRGLGAWRVPTVIVPSPSLDALSGVVDAAEPLGVGLVLVAPEVARLGESPVRTAAGEMVRMLRERGVEVREIRDQDEIDLGAVRLHVIAAGPEPASIAGVIRRADDSSAMAVLTAGLKAEDIGGLAGSERLPERTMVIEMPLHGTVHADAATLIGRLRPTLGIISGDQADAAARWGANLPALSTAERGCVSIMFDANGEIRTRMHR